MPSAPDARMVPDRKVFVVGLSKTGTSTLKEMLTTLGYHVCGPRKELLAQVRAGNVGAVDPTLDAYDAFEDWPWPLVYRHADEKYGAKARFILTRRKDAETWFRSVENHGLGTSPLKSMRDAYGHYRPFGRKTAFVKTYEEHRGPIRGRKVVWTGDGNNVFASFAHAAGQFGFDLTFTGPAQLDPDEDAMGFARKQGVSITVERDAAKAVEGADLVVTDTWVSMHDAQSSRERRHNMLRPYQVNVDLMRHAKPDALFMHCLPAHRGEEVTSEVMDGPQSVIFDEAENRLHAQKAIMRYCLGV